MATVLVSLSPSDDDVVVQNCANTSGSDSSSSGPSSWSLSSIGLDLDVGDGNENTSCPVTPLPLGAWGLPELQTIIFYGCIMLKLCAGIHGNCVRGAFLGHARQRGAVLHTLEMVVLCRWCLEFEDIVVFGCNGSSSERWCEEHAYNHQPVHTRHTWGDG